MPVVFTGFAFSKISISNLSCFSISLFKSYIHGTKDSRMDKVKFSKSCFPQIFFGPFLNTLLHMLDWNKNLILSKILDVGTDNVTRAVTLTRAVSLFVLQKNFLDYFIDCIGADTTDRSLWPGFGVNITGNCIDDNKLEVSWSPPKRKFPNHVFQSKGLWTSQLLSRAIIMLKVATTNGFQHEKL